MVNRVPQNIKTEDLLPLRQQEADLLHLLRNVYRFGNVEIVMRDGIPYDIIRTVERKRLGSLSTSEFDET